MILAKQIQCLCVYNVYICLYKSAQARVGLHSSVDSKEKHKVLGLPVLGAWLYFPAMLATLCQIQGAPPPLLEDVCNLAVGM